MFVFIIELIIIISLEKYRNTGDSKYWNIFTGSIIANFTALILTFIGSLTLELIMGYFIVFLCGLTAVINVILLIVGLKIKKKLKSDEPILDSRSIAIWLIVVVLSAIIIIFIPVIKEEMINNAVSNYALTYLNDKYGDNAFEILSVEKAYPHGQENLKKSEYHEVTISSPLLSGNFTMNVHGTDPKLMTAETDDFVNKYYKKTISEHLQQKYNSDLRIVINRKKIPYNLRHIPTFDELIDYEAINDFNITVYDMDNNENERIETVKDLSFDLIEFLNISKDYEIDIWVDVNEESYYYTLHTSNSSFKISSKEGKVYEFNLNDLNGKSHRST